MVIAIMQPYFFPYLGYFELINTVDRFVFYDDVNFIKKGWVNRNNLLMNEKPTLVTIPCKSTSQNKLINEIHLAKYDYFITKFLKSISHSYSKCRFYGEFFPLLESFFHSFKGKTLSEFNIASTTFICSILKIETTFKVSSVQHNASRGLEKQARLVEICIKENASIYINSIGGIDLYNKDFFKRHGIELKFIDPILIEYSQSSSTFIPGLSIIDVLMNNSIEDVRIKLMKSKFK